MPGRLSEPSTFGTIAGAGMPPIAALSPGIPSNASIADVPLQRLASCCNRTRYVIETFNPWDFCTNWAAGSEELMFTVKWPAPGANPRPLLTSTSSSQRVQQP